MKKLLTLALMSAMLLSSAVSVFADDSTGLALSEKSHLKVENGIVDMIDGTLTVGELKSNFVGAVDVAGKADDAVVCSDDVVTAGGESAKAIIWGDVDRNGKINLTDASNMLKSIAKWEVSIADVAADVDRSGVLNLSDVAKLMKKLAKWDDISLGNVRWVFENKKITSESDDAALDLFFETPLIKIRREDTASTGEYSYKVKLAKNEVESCQFFVTSTEDREGLTAELGEFVHEFGEGTLTSEILREYYYDLVTFESIIPFSQDKAVGGYFAEPLIPNETSFEVAGGRSQGFMVNITTDEDTPAGMYKAPLVIKDSVGKTVRSAELYVYVWDFTLPVTPYSASAFGINRGSIADRGSSDEYATPEEQYTVYYEKLLEYRVTPSELPYDILDERSDEYMSDPRVTSFRTMPELGGYAYTDFFGDGNVGDIGASNANWDPVATGEKLIATMEKVNSRSDWAYKSYFTIMDEPYDPDGYNRIRNVDEWMKGLLGDIDFNLMLCMASNGVYTQSPEFIDLALFVQPYLDIWCPQSCAYTLHDDTTPRAYRWNSSTRS
ncbi:MAG: dockerin type I repeat-containing protein, partial [Clostridia bacterium]|nr:dockerin type I repeat-containing protein [Clostridia bacterium]